MKPSGPRQDADADYAKNEDERPGGKPNAREAGNPSQNSRQKAATNIQSSVTPEDYPADERAAQSVTGGPPPGGAKD
ncbi:MAG: hypothetical protein ABW194_06110 [Novosphingobium sp.]